MIDRELSEVTEGVLRNLISEGTREGKTLEFKQLLAIDETKARLKFLRGVISFANASGGDMVFGMGEGDDGEASFLAPLNDFDPDRDLLKIRDIIRMNIEPRTVLVEFQPVPLADGGIVLVIRIRKSWAGPHFVTFNGDNKFFTRDQNGRRPMDVPEIRNACGVVEGIADKINRFRLERIGNIVAGETPVILRDHQKIALHLLPFCAFDRSFQCDTSALLKSHLEFCPLGYSGARDVRYDVDGIFSAIGREIAAPSAGYIQLFRSGCVEAVDARQIGSTNPLEMHMRYLEEMVIEKVARVLAVFRLIGVEPPVAVMLSLLGVKGCRVFVPSGHSEPDGAHPIFRENLMLPPVVIETLEVVETGEAAPNNVCTLLRPIFDAFWNSLGYSGSPYYSGSGAYLRTR